VIQNILLESRNIGIAMITLIEYKIQTFKLLLSRTLSCTQIRVYLLIRKIRDSEFLSESWIVMITLIGQIEYKIKSPKLHCHELFPAFKSVFIL